MAARIYYSVRSKSPTPSAPAESEEVVAIPALSPAAANKAYSGGVNLFVVRAPGTPGWAISSGSCTHDGACVMSPGWPGNYVNNGRCSITVTAGGVVTAESFDTESGYDYVTLAGATYQGTSGPQAVSVPPSPATHAILTGLKAGESEFQTLY